MVVEVAGVAIVEVVEVVVRGDVEVLLRLLPALVPETGAAEPGVVERPHLVPAVSSVAP